MNGNPLKEATIVSLGLTELNTAFSTELIQNIRFFPSMVWPVQCVHFSEKDCTVNKEMPTTFAYYECEILYAEMKMKDIITIRPDLVLALGTLGSGLEWTITSFS